MTDHDTIAVWDAITEAELAGPVDFAAGLRFIPDEFHSQTRNLRTRFAESAIANARAVGRSAYTVALFALDIA